MTKRWRMTTLAIGLFFLIAPFVGNAAVSILSWPATGGTNINSGLATLNPAFEPSGIVDYDGTLLVVSDEGYVAQIDMQGNLLRTQTSVGFDLEGITKISDDNALIYLLQEYPQRIVEFSVDSWALTGKSWTLQGMTGNSSSGAEAVAYNVAKDLFYVGSQYDGDIYVYDINRSASASVNYVSKIDTGVSSDLAGMYYSVDTEVTYVDFDSSNLLQEYNNDNELINQYSLAGSAQEGVAVITNYPDEAATIVIAQDSGAVMSYDNYPVVYPAVEPDPEPEPEIIDGDGDGYAVEMDCNDADASVYTEIEYYADNDGDGLGNPALTTLVCSASAPAGYVTNGSDLNDNDYDNDNVSTIDDCNDADPSISSELTYYYDVDGDGLGNPALTIFVCSYDAPVGYVTNGSDLNDNDYDNDNVSTIDDCNDVDATISDLQTYYADTDSDGLGDPENSTAICSYEAPSGYVTNADDEPGEPVVEEPVEEPEEVELTVEISGKYTTINSERIKTFYNTPLYAGYMTYAAENGGTDIVVYGVFRHRVRFVVYNVSDIGAITRIDAYTVRY